MRRLLAALTLLPALAAADPDAGPARDRQAQVRADTELFARRVGTMLRVMEHYKLDAAAEAKLLDEAAGTLTGLSQKQMADVIARLDAAMSAADADAARAHLDAAYAGHRDAMRKLKGLLANYDAIRDLDAAAARLDKLARDELEMAFRVADILRDSLDGTSTDPARRRRAIRADFPTTRARHEAEEAADLRKDFETITRQLAALKIGLPDEPRDRLGRAELLARGRDLDGRLDELSTRIRPEGTPDHRHRDWQAAIDAAWTVAGELQEVALTLRPGRDRVQVLAESRQVVAGLIDQVVAEARTATEFYLDSPADDDGARSRQFADDAGRLAHATRAVRLAVAAAAPEAAECLNRAARALWAASAAHRQVAPLFARPLQAWAEAQLRQALAALEGAAARAEAERSDPLTAAAAALAKVEQLIKDQASLHQETQDMARHSDDSSAQKQAPRQQELADRGAELARAPLPSAARTQEILNEAARAMAAAARQLADRQPQPAARDQAEALARLHEARKELAKEKQAIEHRRQDMVRLEEARKKLDELTQAQQKLAADAAHDQADTKALAQQQGQLTPPTEQLAKTLDRAAPDAAKRTQQAARNMDAAKSELSQNKAPDGAEKADQAAKDLQRAQEMVFRALEAQKAQEAIDQAKMQPDRIDPAQAAREVAKAMEAAADAAKSAQQAATSPLVDGLADRQQKVAEQAQEMGQPKAAEPAQKAAKELKNGELQDAVVQQQKALRQLDKASDLANEQRSIMDTTKTLADSQAANQMAQSAVQQAMAQSPQAVQPQLDQASRRLAEAGQELQQAKPAQAGQAQAQASQALGQALRALQQAAGQMAKDAPPGQKPGQKPGQQADSSAKATSQERNEKIASGDRTADGVKKDVKAQLNAIEGDGSFLHLPPRQRELIRQALAEKLPPEYAAMIQQYFVNIAKGKPAAKPAGEPPRDK